MAQYTITNKYRLQNVAVAFHRHFQLHTTDAENTKESDETIDEWFQKAKSIRSEIHFEPTAIDHFATQNRTNRIQRMPEMEDFTEDDEQRFKQSFEGTFSTIRRVE